MLSSSHFSLDFKRLIKSFSVNKKLSFLFFSNFNLTSFKHNNSFAFVEFGENRYYGITGGKMLRRLFVLFFFLLGSVLLLANPIVPGPKIVRLNRAGNAWQLVLFNEAMEEYNLDNCGLSFGGCFSAFNSGIEFYDYATVSNLDLVTPLEINWTTDTLITYFDQGYGFWEADEWCFGPNISWLSSVNPLLDGQSLIRVYPYYDWLMYVKDSNLEGGLRTRGYLEGYVYDYQNNPVSGATIRYYRLNSWTQYIFDPEVTNTTGYYCSETYAKNYDVSVIIDNLVYIDTFLTVEPDSVITVDFYTDYHPSGADDYEVSLPASGYNLSNYPNPFNPTTEISFNLTTNLHALPRIEIYNSKGQKVKVLECSNSFAANTRNSYSSCSVTWNGLDENGKPVTSGVYYYKLISGDKELAANKMLLLK